MAIYKPENWLTADDLELLELLAQILTQPAHASSNLSEESIPLTPAEAGLNLLEQLVSLKEFRETAHFVEGLTQQDVTSRDDLKEIYLSRRKTSGRSRVISSTHWRAFLNRMGITKFSYSSASRADIYTTRMTYEHFLKMERRLIVQRHIPLRIRAVIVGVVDKYENEVEEARNGINPLKSGSIVKVSRSILESLNRNKKTELEPLKSSQLAGLATLIADSSVLFTTRDWSVAGTMSAMAGGFSATAY
ncbi:hypothetical protein [Parasphingorhabdus sp.]|uniref:hypothetical protein n=1 Tax=Parasphingorhabdus sp. TaxID=2709688 RepID=UPI0030021D42